MSSHTPSGTSTTTNVNRQSLIEAHQNMVRSMAFDVMRGLPLNITVEDLIGYGNLGLVEAAERFDPKRGVSFATFAYYRVRGAIFDGLREMGHLSRGDYEVLRHRFAAQATELIQVALDDASAHPSVTSPATVDDDIARVQSLLDDLLPAYLLSLNTDKIPELGDSQMPHSSCLEQTNLYRLAVEAMRELPADDCQLLEALYVRHLSAKEFAAAHGLSKSWVSRLHLRALKRLRTKLIERKVFAASEFDT